MALTLNEQLQQAFTELCNAPTSLSEKLSATLLAKELLTCHRDQMGNIGDALIENTKLRARVTELEKADASTTAAGASTSADTKALQAKIGLLESENAALRVGGNVPPTSAIISLTAERDLLRTKVSQLEQSSGAYVANLSPKLRQAESVITRVHGFVAGLQLKNLTEEAATAKGVQLSIESITSQRDAYKKAFMGIKALVGDAVQATVSGTLTERCLAAKGGKK